MGHDGSKQDLGRTAFECDVPTAFRLPPPGAEFDLEKYPVLAPLPDYPDPLAPKPRLILTAERLGSIRRDIEHGFLRSIWPRLWQSHLEHHRHAPEPMQRVSREDSYVLTWRALRWAVLRESAMLQETADLLEVFAGTPIVGHLDSLVASEVCTAVALTLDWAGDDLPAEHTAQARRWLAATAAQVARSAESGATWWADCWLQNHAIVNECGIGLAGMVLADAPEASLRRVGLELYQHALTGFRKAVFYQPPDGSTPELCRYAYFMTEAQFTFFEALRTFSGEDLYGSFARRRIDYIIQQIIPAPTSEADILNWGDNDRSCWPHPPTSLLYCLARRFNHRIAQGAADWLVMRNVGIERNKNWLIPLMREASLQPAEFPPQAPPLPASYHAEDQGLVTLRSSWTENATMIGMLCGPFQGHRMTQLVSKDIGAAHRHPDNASLQICVGKTYLVVDPGYEYLKSTANHNTILIDGQGQTGEGNTWLNVNNCLNREGKALGIETFEDKGEFCHVVAQAAGAYDPDLQLGSFRRRLIFVRPDLLVVHDRLESVRPHEYRWLLHTEPGRRFTEIRPGYWRLEAGNVGLDICALRPGPEELCHEVRLHRITRSRFVKETRRLDLYAASPHRAGEFLVILKVLRGENLQARPMMNVALQQDASEMTLLGPDLKVAWPIQELRTPQVTWQPVATK